MTHTDEPAARPAAPPDAPPDTDAAPHPSFNSASLIMLAAAATLYVVLRVWRLTGSCLWFDEVFSVHAARHDWSGMTAFLIQDLIHPPLFYALLKIWITAGGESLFWLRLFPALAAVIALVPLVLLCRELRLGNTATTIAVGLAALNGYLIKYAQEVRMYSLLLLLTLGSLWLFARFTNARTPSKKLLGLLFAVNLLLVYTHYFGWLVVTTEFALLFVYGTRQKRAGFSLVAGLTVVCFSPWAYAVGLAAAANRGLGQNIGWAARPTLGAVGEFLTTLNEILYYRQSSNEPAFFRWSAWLGAVLFGVPLAVLAWRRWRSRADEPCVPAASLRLLVSCFGLPVLMAFAASWALPYSIWGMRHLIIVVVPYLVLVALALDALRPLWLKTSVLLVVGGWTLLMTFVVAIRSDTPYVWCAWDTLAREVVEIETARDAPAVKIYVFEDLVAYHTWFALDSMKQSGFKVDVVRGVPGAVEDPAYFLPRGFDAVATRDAANAFGEDRFWIAFRDASQNPHRAPLEFLTARGFQTGAPLEVTARGNRAFMVPVTRR